MSREVSQVDGAETKGRKECLESTVVLVDTASSGSKLDVMVEDMAMLVELTKEEMLETEDVTNWSASSIETGSSCVPSCKVPAGSIPTEVENEGETCSESARLTSS
jgi:hypothetical protein